MNRSLNQNGYPLNPRSFFIGIRREILSTINFIDAMRARKEVCLPVRFIEEWKLLKGFVEHINQFPDGQVVHLRPTGDLLYWPEAVIWIPSSGSSAGVLS